MKFILTSFLLLFSTVLYAQDPPEKYQKIWDAFTDFEYDQVQKLADKALKKNPKDPWLYWIKGMAQVPGIENTEEEEIRCYSKALELDSSFVAAYSRLAYSMEYSENPDLVKIEYLYTKSLALDSTDMHVRVDRSDFYLKQKRYDDAIADAKKAKQMGAEGYPLWLANKIIITALHEQHKTADLNAFLGVVDPNDGGGPDDPDYQYLLATIYESFGDKQKACAAYRRALSEQEFYDSMVEEGETPQHQEWYKTAQEKVKKCK